MSGAHFRIAYFPHVHQQIADLSSRAAVVGIKDEFLTSLKSTIKDLLFKPKKVGDPLYRTHFPGGFVYRATKSPFIMEYAVYEAEQLVMVLSVSAFPLAFSK